MQVVRTGGAQFEIEQSGNGPDLLLLHSLLTDPGSFSAIVPALSRTRRVTLVSLPGFGRSTPAGPSIEDSADRLAELVSSLGEKADVLGNGYGGSIAVAFAARHGAKLGKLVLADTGAAFPEAGRAPFRAMAEAVERNGMAAIVDVAVRRIFPESYLAAHPADRRAERSAATGQSGKLRRGLSRPREARSAPRASAHPEPDLGGGRHARRCYSARSRSRARLRHSRSAAGRDAGLRSLPSPAAAGGIRRGDRTVSRPEAIVADTAVSC